MARLRSKSCRNKIFTERVSSGEAESLGAKAPAGECGVKDQVRRADSLIFVDDEHKGSDCTVEYHGANLTLCYYLINAICKGACTAQNYVK